MVRQWVTQLHLNFVLLPVALSGGRKPMRLSIGAKTAPKKLVFCEVAIIHDASMKKMHQGGGSAVLNATSRKQPHPFTTLFTLIPLFRAIINKKPC